VLEDTGAEITDAARIRDIEQQLSHVLSKPDNAAMTVTRRAPRQVRMFTTATQVAFSGDPVNGRTVIEIIAGDRPGLLSQVAKVFMSEDVKIFTSKIMTVGERAEDVFYVTNGSGGPLSGEEKDRLSQRIIETLDRRV
jgi:[protein-PII] uridylyltransferase